MSGATVAVYGLAGVMFTGLCTILAVVIKNSKGSPERTTADAQAWSLVNGGLIAEVQRLTEKSQQQDQRLTDLDDGIRTVKALNLWLSRRVDQLVAFIVDLGHEPPPESEPRPPDADLNP